MSKARSRRAIALKNTSIQYLEYTTVAIVYILDFKLGQLKCQFLPCYELGYLEYALDSSHGRPSRLANWILDKSIQNILFKCSLLYFNYFILALDPASLRSCLTSFLGTVSIKGAFKYYISAFLKILNPPSPCI